MAADELAGGDFELKLSTEINASFFLCLASTVCDENVRADGAVSTGTTN